MKKKFVTLCVLAGAALSFVAQAQTNMSETQQRINAAVMAVYNEELARNPYDYALLYSRANQYFLNGEYLKSLEDINNALTYIPKSDESTLFESYVLRAKIYIIRNEQEKAITDLKMANTIKPVDQHTVLLLGDMCFESGDYETAKSSYTTLLRRNSLDFHAMAGLAKVAVMQKDYDEAARYANRAVDLYPAEPRVYLNRSDVLVLMNDYKGAAQDVISAISVSNDMSGALQRLVDMSHTNYADVIGALSNSIDKAPDVGMFYYIRAHVAMQHNHYSAALKDLNLIIDKKLYDYHGIYYYSALVNFNLSRYMEALNRVNTAIMMNAEAPEYYVLKARIQSAMGMTKDGLQSVYMALGSNPNYIDALREKSLLHILDGNYKDALTTINEALLNDPTIAENILLRAWLSKTYLKGETSAKNDYMKVLDLEDDIYSLRGVALYGLGRFDEAKAWADKIVAEYPTAGGESYYTASVVYALCGDNDKALDLLESALANGYGNYYAIYDYREGEVNLLSLRSLPRFKEIVNRYDKVFE
ncbi:MAG: tetratricopeptide repeat protein [Muribaculaceae bacterium]|jgi:tetratricopeptide (TPR) repeat protein|nr:tetratricopeptide repeat protein [Muribaculaceae bacterium]MEE1338622.1 tetratricopeptide repeat protein [Muribaculaceae bacterium]